MSGSRAVGLQLEQDSVLLRAEMASERLSNVPSELSFCTARS